MKLFPSQIAQQEEHKTEQFRSEGVATIMTAPLVVTAMVEYVCDKKKRDWSVEIGVMVIEAIDNIIDKNSLKFKK